MKLDLPKNYSLDGLERRRASSRRMRCRATKEATSPKKPIPPNAIRTSLDTGASPLDQHRYNKQQYSERHKEQSTPVQVKSPPLLWVHTLKRGPGKPLRLKRSAPLGPLFRVWTPTLFSFAPSAPPSSPQPRSPPRHSPSPPAPGTAPSAATPPAPAG